MSFDHQLLAAARVADFERIALEANLQRQARESRTAPHAANGPYPIAGSSIPQTPMPSPSAS